jgi:hypothetical protein
VARLMYKDLLFCGYLDGTYELNGTYELIGEKINGNPERMFAPDNLLIKHCEYKLWDAPRDYEGIKEYLHTKNQESYLEGIVWHHPDERMVKIKYKDFFKKGFF